MQIDYTITIQKPLFDVFRLGTDYNSFASWQPRVKTSVVMPGDPVRTGSNVSIEKEGLLGTTFVNADLIDFQRNKMVEMNGIYGRFRFRRKTEYNSGGRETVVRERLEMNPGCLYFWYTPFLQRALLNEMKREWEAAKKRLETGS